jgi:selenocysteine lyase/cysteine desulfurase
VRFDPATGLLDWEDLARCVTERTRLLAIGAASNALGTISDVARAAALAHDAGALCFVDGVHYAPHVLPDVAALGCDGFACSPYKFYGPHLGVLWLRADLIEDTPFPKLVPASVDAPERGETGTLNHEGIVGAAAAVEWLASLSETGGSLRARLEQTYAALHDRARTQIRMLWEGLATLPAVQRYGPPAEAPRTPTVGFVVEGLPSAAVARALADRSVFVSHGDFYAHTVVARLGLQPEGIVRAGCACYTTDEEVERLLAGVRSLNPKATFHAT